MADIDICELLWDDANEVHIWERHQLSRDLVEEACYGDPQNIKVRDTRRGRLLINAPLQDKRILTVILAPFSEGKYYPVSAYVASKKDHREYHEWKVEKEL